jgi:hypothetical protein
MNAPCKLSSYSASSPGAYARVKVTGKMVGLTRVLYAKHHGLELADLDGKVIMHTCDNPACVEVTHLVLGTQQENVQDMWNKGRQGVKGMQGSSHPMSKLTEDIVRQIREDKSSTGKTLAIRHGVSRATVSMIRTGKIWKEALVQKKIPLDIPSGGDIVISHRG